MIPPKLIVGGIAAFLGFLILLFIWPFVVVAPGDVGVLALFGQVNPTPLEAGFHAVNPFAHVYKVNIQLQKSEEKGEAASSDLQAVHTILAVNYKLSGKSVPALYSSIGLDYEAKIINPVVQDRFKSVTAQYTAEHLISRREEVRQKIRTLVSEAVTERSAGAIVVQDVLITNFQFGEAFNHAIEQKQVAEQLALKAQRDLERIKIEAEQRVAQAQAEAKAIQIQAQSISAQGGEAYVRLKSVEKWDGKLPQYILGSNSMPFIKVQ